MVPLMLLMVVAFLTFSSICRPVSSSWRLLSMTLCLNCCSFAVSDHVGFVMFCKRCTCWAHCPPENCRMWLFASLLGLVERTKTYARYCDALLMSFLMLSRLPRLRLNSVCCNLAVDDSYWSSKTWTLGNWLTYLAKFCIEHVDVFSMSTKAFVNGFGAVPMYTSLSVTALTSVNALCCEIGGEGVVNEL